MMNVPDDATALSIAIASKSRVAHNLVQIGDPVHTDPSTVKDPVPVSDV